ncbi:MAG: hypothetical protein V3S14_16715 [Anaerolineae bacterium]
MRGPLWVTGYVSRLDEAKRDEWWELDQRVTKEASRTVPELALYWANDQRTVAEIVSASRWRQDWMSRRCRRC